MNWAVLVFSFSGNLNSKHAAAAVVLTSRAHTASTAAKARSTGQRECRQVLLGPNRGGTGDRRLPGLPVPDTRAKTWLNRSPQIAAGRTRAGQFLIDETII